MVKLNPYRYRNGDFYKYIWFFLLLNFFKVREDSIWRKY